MKHSTGREYWMTYDAPELASKLETYHQRYFGRGINPVYQMWMRNSYAYYSTVLDSQSWMSALRFEGDQGELVKMAVPQARSLIRQLLTLVGKQKLAFQAIAQVQKSDVTEEVRIANAICEDTVDKQNLDVQTEYMVELGLVIGTAFMKATWRSDKGTPKGVVTNASGREDVVYDGDLEISTPHLLDMVYDFTLPHWTDNDWAECRVKRSRWSLIAQHPEIEQEILNLPSVYQDKQTRSILGMDDDDMVYVYELYHRPTPALPRGRMMMYSSSQTIYFDDENKYGCIPIEQFKPEPIAGLGFGYPMLSNLLPAQEMYDHDLSAIATNHSGLGVQNVCIPRGADVDVRQIYGMNYMAYTPQDVPGGGKPEPLNLVNSSPELFKLPEVLLSNMQQMSNINAAVRGEVGSSTSGVAIATLTTNALEFLTSYSKASNSVLEKIMMHSINAYKKFATVPRLISITGRNYQSFSRYFTGDKLAPIQAIKIQAINPLMMTIAGRMQVAETSIKEGMVKSLQDYAAILDGQPLSKLFETELSQSDLIQSENEMMQDGQNVLPLSIDDHPMHIFKHKVLLNDPRIRKDQGRVKIVLDHIAEHDRLAKETDPMLQAMANTGRMPEGGIPPPAAPPPGGGGGNEELPPDQPALPTAEPAQPADDLLGRPK